MAAPAVVGTPTETAISTASTSHVVNLPSGAAGNMFLAILSKGSAGTTPSVNTLTGWTELLDEAIVLGLYAAVKECDGTEGSTTTFTLSSATRGAWIVYEISGQATTASQLPEIGTTATGSSTTPNPPSRAVTNGPKDILAIAFAGRAGEEADDDTWATASPTTPVTFSGLRQIACGVAGTNLAGILCSASATANTATMDPGTFTIATGAWRANTIVIHPAPATHAIAAALDVTPTVAVNLTRVEKYFDDDFPGSSLDARWIPTNGTPTVGSGLLNLDIEAIEGVAVTGKDLTGNQVAFRTDTFPSGSGAPYAYLSCYIDGSHYVSILINETHVQATKDIGSGFTSLASVAINPTNQRWCRIKEAAGTTYWQYSADGTTWTTLHSEANPITMTSLTFLFETGPDGTEVSDWKIDRILYASGADNLAIAAALDVSPALAVALGRETFVAANLSLTPTLAVALLRETFIAANLPITPTLAAALSRETFIAAAHDLGLTMAVNLEVEAPAGTEYFIAASLDLGFNAAAALGRETFVSANLPLDLQMAAALTREMFIAAALNMPVTVAVNMTRETFIAASLDLGQAAEVRLILDMMIAANFPIGLPVTVNIRIEGGPVQMYIYRTLLGVG